MNNPAGRLLYWLELGDARPKGESAMGQWCEVFGLDYDEPGNRTECVRRGMVLASLAQAVRREASALPADLHPDVMLTHFNEVEAALTQFTVLPSSTMQQMFSQMGGTGWQSLRMLDAMLSSHRPEVAIDPASISEHLDKVRELIDGILGDTDLAPDLKRYLVARLRDIEAALTDALITGSRSVELAVNSLYGAARLKPDLWERIGQTKWGPRVGAAWLALMTTLGGVGAAPALMPSEPDAPTHIEIQIAPDSVTDGDAPATSEQ